jgi:hypothetical protein
MIKNKSIGKVRGNTNNPHFCLGPVWPRKINVSHWSILCQYLSRRILRQFRLNQDSCGTFGVLGGIIVHPLGTEPAKATAAEHHIWWIYSVILKLLVMLLYFQFITIVCSALDFLWAPAATIVAICDNQHSSIKCGYSIQ